MVYCLGTNQADDRMYEAPDRYKRMISARLPDGESLGVASRQPDEMSSPLRDAQLIARGHFAPFFAAANSVAAVLMAMILYGHVPAAYLGRALAIRSILGIGIGAAAPAAFGAVLDLSAPGQGWGWAFVLMGVGGVVATVCAALLPRAGPGRQL